MGASSSSSFFAGEQQEEGFRRFLAALPPALATLITPIPPMATAPPSQGNGEGENGDGASCASPQAALKQLVAAIEVR